MLLTETIAMFVLNRFQKFNAPAKPESADVHTFLPKTGVLSTAMSKGGTLRKNCSTINGDGSQKYADELLSLTMFHDAAFTGFFEDSLDLLCSHMHTIEDSRVPKIATKYENNPKLWRKYGENHSTCCISPRDYLQRFLAC